MYLETRRTTQATSCKDNILKMMLRISGGRVSNVHRVSLRLCVSCPHCEDTLRRFGRIWFLPGPISKVVENRDHNQAQPITAVKCEDHARPRITVTINRISECSEKIGIPKILRVSLKERELLNLRETKKLTLFAISIARIASGC